MGKYKCRIKCGASARPNEGEYGCISKCGVRVRAKLGAIGLQGPYILEK